MKKVTGYFLLPFLLMAVMFVGLPSCSDDDDDEVEEATLQVSQTSLSFDKGGNSASIGVTTNQADWVATSPDEGKWLELKQEGNNLTVTAAANTMGEDRSSWILVQASTKFAKIQVTQSAADMVIDISPQEVNFGKQGGQKRIDVRSNSGNWTVVKEDEDVDWLQVQSFKYDVEITVAPSKEKDTRTAKLIASCGKATKEIVVNQGGLGDTRFVLPYLENMLPTKYDIVHYEQENGNVFIEYVEPLIIWGGIYPGYFLFSYASPLFDDVTYDLEYGSDAIVDVIMSTSQGAQELISEDFQNFLKDNGFTDIKANKKAGSLTATFENDNCKVSLAIITHGEKGRTTYSFKHKQPRPYPTFDKFPYLTSTHLQDGKDPWTKDQMMKWEKDRGNVVGYDVDAGGPFIRVDLKNAEDRKESAIMRMYFLTTTEEDALIEQMLCTWSDITKGAYEVAEGIYQITDEFIALIDKEGFEYLGTASSGDDIYINRDESSEYLGMLIVGRAVAFEDVSDGAPLFCINYWHQEGVTANNKKAIIDKISSDLERSDKILGRIKK